MDSRGPEPYTRVLPSAALSLFGAAIVVFANLYAPQPLLPIFRQTFHQSEPAVSLIISVAVLGIAVGSILAGPLSDRIGRKNVMTASTFLLAFPTVGAACAHSLFWFLVARALTGLLIPGVIAVVIAYVSEEYQRPATSLLMGLYVSSTVAGGLVGRLAAGVMTAVWGWRTAFFVIGGAAIVASAVLKLWLPPSRRFHPRSSWFTAIVGLKRSFADPALVSLGFLGFTYFFAFISSFTYES